VSAGTQGWLAPVLVVFLLVMVNLLNNRWAPWLYVPTGIVGSAALLGIAWWDGASWDDLGLDPSTWASGLLWGAVTLAAVVLVYAVGLSIPVTRRGFDDARAAAGGAGRLAYRTLVHIPVGTVLLEEVAFRAVLLATLTPHIGLWWAIVASSVLFGLWHVLPALGMLESNAGAAAALGSGRRAQIRAVALTVVGTGLAGVGLCVLLVVSGSLLAPMWLHWSLNSLGTIVAWVRGRVLRIGP
jgi:membrane protease YdiL (CAAX protease family)